MPAIEAVSIGVVTVAFEQTNTKTRYEWPIKNIGKSA
jgi:hypothetical protein